ncbi:Interactor of constitutive active ROPs [Quillaja saponaria]|uniref:Interactor of constitutive active ROPs n=1 Tax=Quillaja saponaria TaxID=32244 RepID=A0AAD7KXL8_QUISA|nr:Interactor of constitutive active ROPs [Quillaja saponaria]KAJ7947764.1 Interactor of constitutive active ROPs [Quillaja saponaria]
MQTPKGRSSSSEVPQKVSPRAARQLKPSTLVADSAAVPVSEKKRPSRISELETQISHLQEELKRVKDQLKISEACKKQAQQDAEESKRQLLTLTAKLENSQQQLLELSASEEARVNELHKISQESDEVWKLKLEAVQKQNSIDSAALASSMNEIQQLKVELDLVSDSETAQTKTAESANVELQNLKAKLADTLSIVENMENQLRDCKESEVQAQAVVKETLLQLETAKKTVEVLRDDAAKTEEGYKSVASELDQSKARVNLLEQLISKLESDLSNINSFSGNLEGACNLDQEFGKSKVGEESTETEEELCSLKSEVGQLRSALETAETKCLEEQSRSTVQIRNAYELVEQIKSESSLRESELEAELKIRKANIEELKANLMDKETELQGIVAENEELNFKLEKNHSCQREYALEKEIKGLNDCIAELRANLMDKETALQSISEENEMLKLEMNKTVLDGGKVNGDVGAEIEEAMAAEQVALMKLGIAMEEADKSNRKAARVVEQLEAAQAANLEMEADLRRLKVQSDQWRKAAEAAAAMLSAGNNGKFMERNGSLDSNYDPLKCSPYCEDLDDDFQKKKNGNMLKKIGVLWKKPQK